MKDIKYTDLESFEFFLLCNSFFIAGVNNRKSHPRLS
jgi:hypothetical protein